MAIEKWESEQQQTLSSILARLDIALSALRDSLLGSGDKTLTDVETAVKGLQSASETLQDVINAILELRGASDKNLSDVDLHLATLLGTQQNRDAWVHGVITISTSGSPVQGPDIAVPDGFSVVLIYHPDNSGRIGVGRSSTDANLTTGAPVILSAEGQSLALKVSNLNLLWFDASADGEKVIYAVEQ